MYRTQSLTKRALKISSTPLIQTFFFLKVLQENKFLLTFKERWGKVRKARCTSCLNQGLVTIQPYRDWSPVLQMLQHGNIVYIHYFSPGNKIQL